MSSPKLLRDRRFWPLFWTQFLGAMNDNVFKNAIVILITFQAAQQGFSLMGLSDGQVVALSGGVFMLPFFLFSATAGQLADKVSKTRLIFWIKVCEVLIMCVGAYGFIARDFHLLLVTLFFMGTHSTFFGPIKYSILPDLLTLGELVRGNALVESGTFIAILLGTILGGLLISIPGVGPEVAAGVVVMIALCGVLTSLKVMFLKPADPSIRVDPTILRPTAQIIGMSMKNKAVFQSILGISWFWLLGLAFLSVLPPYCKEVLAGDESLVTFFLALFTIGVGVGALTCEKLSFHRLELGIVPLGSLGFTVFLVDLFLIGKPAVGQSFPEFLNSLTGWRITIDFLLFSFSGGLFSVPLYTLIQQRSEGAERSRVIAGNNIVNAFFMVLSSLLLMVLMGAGIETPAIFLIFAILNLAVAAYIYTVIPEFMFRFLCWVLANIIYRLRVVGATHIPNEGPALLVCNHVTYIDWLIIASATQRPIRFVMHYSFANIPIARRLFKDALVIPIAGAKEDPDILKTAYESIARELRAGELVAIFPEGGLSPDGTLKPFRSGVERILQENPVPVIPLRLDGLWGSFFSRRYGRAMSRPFRRFWSRVTLKVGAPLDPQTVTAPMLQQCVSGL